MTKPVLPTSLPPRGLNQAQAAEYVGVSPSLFQQMVDDGRMPKPKTINARKVWDRLRLDEAFAMLPIDGNEGANPWDVLLDAHQDAVREGGRRPSRQRSPLREDAGT